MATASQDLLSSYLTAPQAADALHVHAHTLKRWRFRSYGPQPVRIGQRLYYRVVDIEQWLASLGQSDAAKVG